jgi:phosphohistidine swiveling domain-containing protein
MTDTPKGTEMATRHEAAGRSRRRTVFGPGLAAELDGSGHPATEVGGKGASLDVLVRLGFPVPHSAALTADAYRSFVKSAGLTSFISDLARTRVTSLEAAEEEWHRIEKAFLDAELSADVEKAILTAWDRVSEGQLVAVRSSATAEDMSASSFAGQYLSVLEVDGPAAAEEAVRRVWASLWHPAARAYRERMGIDNEGLAMGVVIQRMVPATHSGVCFTIDPTSASSAALRLEVVEGLGEALVSGQATPEAYQLSRHGLQPLDGREPPPELREVARTALRIEEEMDGRPQDVEWSIADGRIWVLQARPITTLELGIGDGDGFDPPADPSDEYAPVGVGEMLPGVLPPLLWTVNGPMVEDAFRRLFTRLGVLPEDIGGPFAVIGRFRGQAALNLSLVKDAARRMAGGSGADVERQYLGHAVTTEEDEPRPPRRDRIRKLGPTWRALRLRKRVELEAATFEQIVAEVTSLPHNLDELLSSELLAFRARVRDLAAGGTAAEVGVAAAAVASYRALEALLERWVGDEGAEWVQRITRGAATESDALGTTAARVWSDFSDTPDAPIILEAICRATPEDVEERLRAVGTAGNTFLDRLWAELDVLGSSAVYGGPMWREQRYYVWTILTQWFKCVTEVRQEIADAATRDITELERVITTSKKWRVQRVLTGQIVDVRKRALRRLVDETRALLCRRETSKAALFALGGLERSATLVLADRLVRRGVLGRVEDVELLADWELEDLVSEDRKVPTDELERRRRALYAYLEEPPLPALITGEGVPVSRGAIQPVISGSVTGWAASPGKHRGRVRIISDLAAADELQPGDVLVAAATDPSWTPLFLIAGAIVVERGGPLSHAAIVSRELGLPAVLNAQGATTTLRSGDLVEVDGSSGVVIVIDEAA